MSRFSKNSLERLAKRQALLNAVLAEEGLQGSTRRITRNEVTGPVPMSFAQQRLWVIDRLSPGSPTYNIPVPLRLKGALDVDVLNQSLNEIVRRHAALRTTFTEIDGEPYQVIQPAEPMPLPVIDLATLPPAEREAEAARLTNEDGRYSFDLQRGPLFRATLLRLAETDHILLLNRHHIVSDAWSTGILLQEMVTLYRAYAAGEPSPLPELQVQYTDYTLWQRDWMQGEVLEKQLGYWKQKLGGVTVLELPTDRPRPPALTFEGEYETASIEAALKDKLNALGQEEGATLFMTMTAIYATLLGRYSGQDDIAIGIPIAGRNQDEIANVIGFFVNSLVLRIDLSGKPTFREVLRRVRDTTLEAYANQDVPFEKLVETLLPQRDPSRMPLFQVVFALQNAAAPLEMPGVTISNFPVENKTSKFDLSLFIDERPDELASMVEYNVDLFDASTISRMLGHFHVLTEQVVAHPDLPIAKLPILPEHERQQVLFELNEPAHPYPNDRTIHELIEEHVHRTPDAIALLFEDQQISYREMDERANQVANHLRSLGVGLEVFVGVYMERSVEMIISLLGIFKAGGVYLPLALSDPEERRTFTVEDTRMPVILTLQQYANDLRNEPVKVICLDSDWDEIAQQPREKPEIDIWADNLAYAIYTSGSTGKPKGVMITHRGMCNFIHKLQTYAEPGDRGLLWSSLSFDLSLLQSFMMLATGSTLVIAQPEELLPGPGLVRVLRRHKVTHLNMSPSALAAMPDDELPDVTLIISGGEACSSDLVERWATNRIFYNGYGPTEVTVGNCLYQCVDGSQKPLIGRSLPNTHMYVLNSELQPQPLGVPGELFIGGVGVGRGYLNRPALTAERFIPDPYSSEPGARMYQTGDLFRWLPIGQADYLGRIDHQVKVRGFRIELGEIEVILDQHPAVRDSVVLLREDTPGDKRLVGYIVTSDDEVTVSELRAFMQAKVPEYMVPSAFVLLDALPLTPNGKIDRRALPAPDESRPELSETFVAPRDMIELQLAQIWENVLNVRPIGMTDNFFALGGHSLLAMRLMAQIQKQFDQKLPLSVLFQAGTIDQLAALLRQQHATVPHSPLVPIQPAGSKRPFFCVHAVGGHVLSYMELAQQLGPEQPFYGLQAPGLEGDTQQYRSLEEMAAHYLEAVQTVQPEGPYLLGGWSMGGVVAFEMAQQLQRAGEEVELVALIDSYTPLDEHDGEIFSDEKLVSVFALDLKGLFNLPIADDALLTLTPDEQLQQVVEVAKQTNAMPADTDMPQIRQLLDVFKTNTLLLQHYQPQVYPKRVLLLRASEQPDGGPANPVGSWQALAAGGVELHTVPGNHYTLIRRPNVAELAQRLAEQIGSAPSLANPG